MGLSGELMKEGVAPGPVGDELLGGRGTLSGSHDLFSCSVLTSNAISTI